MHGPVRYHNHKPLFDMKYLELLRTTVLNVCFIWHQHLYCSVIGICSIWEWLLFFLGITSVLFDITSVQFGKQSARTNKIYSISICSYGRLAADRNYSYKSLFHTDRLQLEEKTAVKLFHIERSEGLITATRNIVPYRMAAALSCFNCNPPSAP